MTAELGAVGQCVSIVSDFVVLPPLPVDGAVYLCRITVLLSECADLKPSCYAICDWLNTAGSTTCGVVRRYLPFRIATSVLCDHIQSYKVLQVGTASPAWRASGSQYVHVGTRMGAVRPPFIFSTFLQLQHSPFLVLSSSSRPPCPARATHHTTSTPSSS